MTTRKTGFDAIVGNPPFLGGKRISTAQGDRYRDWLASAHEGVNSNADLVAHFFRRAFSLLVSGGTLGLVATNTISQGDTRRAGLRWICLHGGTIFAARRRYMWPGAAAVVVSVVHITRGPWRGTRQLDDRAVNEITAFLFHSGGSEDPCALAANARTSFIGCDLKSQGFLFDDADEEASPLAEMRALLQKNEGDSSLIHPYLGGEELNSSPTQEPHRFAVDLNHLREDELELHQPLVGFVRTRVTRDRARKSEDVANHPFWRYWRARPELRAASVNCTRVLANSQVSAHHAFAWQPTDRVFAHTLNVFTDERDGFFAVLQSRAHENWARFFGSSMKDDVRYTPSDCFETFPFPAGWEENAALASIGAEYHAFRAELMKRNGQGLTATYNRFHAPDEYDGEILKLRALHDAMDRAVLDAYGWRDLKPVCEFLLDWEEPEDDAGGAPRKKKKPWRWRWPDAMRDEVLARLLALNAERAKDEARRALLAGGSSKKAKGGGKKGAGSGELF